MSSESEDSGETSANNWQIVTKNDKKRAAPSPLLIPDKRNKKDENLPNPFAILADEDDDITDHTPAPSPPKPPPIYIPGVADISKMVTNFRSVLSIDDFWYKSVRNDEIRVMIKNVEAYRKLIKHLEHSKISFHTYQLKQERAFRFAIKGLHHTTSTSSIKAELILLGHAPRNIINIKSRATKQPLPIFFVDLDPSENNKDVYDIKHIAHAVVKIEPIRKSNDLVQCYRCQEFGHTQSYCKKTPRCVKCGLNHPTTDCQKDKNTPPQCVHCLQPHTANYRGCMVYQELSKKNLPSMQKTKNHVTFNQRNVNPIFTANASYADTVKGSNTNVSQTTETTLIAKIEQMIKNQSELMNTMIKMMQMLMTKICN